MNSMNDERFFDLGMKVIARQATDAEGAELDAVLAREPEMRAKFARLQAEVRVAKDALPLVDATRATAGEFPTYARGRLQTKVRQTLGRPATEKEQDRSLAWGWRWVLGLAAAAAVVLFVALPILRTPNAPIIQVAMLDAAGVTRGAETNDVAILQQTWKETTVQTFSKTSEMEVWEKNWPEEGKRPVVKVIYDRAAGEIRVLGHWKGNPIQKTFPIDNDPATALKQANAFVQEQTKH
jgi:hypothetical protein